ncbi:glycine-trna ligase beta subunit [Lucifera butyrica]|uniref:Glycine--tRNA ligase beta subunit n=1 Tax=Lucifera butyrica TaxID=1351585 RepID=A0A498R7C7_9FIRM|nr:glycine--tRNA ligase subunit beta [Lucifera butyrica]VBB06073.1 glycine-trna ligase beta subunit [Lucifera butyrica]
MSKDLLLEIGTEEIPAKFMPGALAQLEKIAQEKLSEQRISYREIQTVGTPRRLSLIVRDMAEQQADRKSENKGPSVKIAFDAAGQPTKAAQGFARGQGVAVANLVEKDGYVYAVVQEVGQAVAGLLPSLLPEMIHSISFPKNMRWGDLDLRFARPIRWLLALYGSEVIPFTIAGVSSGNKTRGHRFLSKGDIVVNSADDYFAKLAANHVMVDQTIRRQVIREQIVKIATQQGGIANIDEDLLEEVIYLVEYPTALCGSFEEKYLALPPEAVITPMREHQRYFPVFSQDGKLLPAFITVRNGGADYIDIVRHGNERVLKARLADAKFFFEEDKKVPLRDRVERLKTIVFQEGLGTLYDKTLRLEQLSVFIAQNMGVAADLLPLIKQGAHLAKADLVTGMVYEFTELQGVMGREYARLNGENAIVADAIFEHYLPRFAGDALPEQIAGRIISIADKLDNIVATFSRGLIPSGSQDPFALRRQALGIANIMIRAQLQLSLPALVQKTMDLLQTHDPERRERLLQEVTEFFRLRLRNILADEGVRYDVIDAVITAGTDNIYDAWCRAKAIAAITGTDALSKAVQAFSRAGNLVKNFAAAAINTDLFMDEAEKKLYLAYEEARTKIDALRVRQDYEEILTVMAEMAATIDAFFGAVMVMVEDLNIRNNRLALLKAITGLTASLADVSKIII